MDKGKFPSGAKRRFYHNPPPPEGVTCELCGAAGVVYDHDHETGQFRGWLCGTCNTGLGRFKDDPDLMERAADYVRAHTAHFARGLLSRG